MKIDSKIFLGIFLVALVSCQKEKETPTPEYDWQAMSFPETLPLTAISMVNSQVGFIGAEHSFDEESYMMSHMSVPTEYGDTLMVMPDTTICKRVADSDFPETKPVLYRTVDGGLSWHALETPFKTGVKGLTFLSADFGVVTTKCEGVYVTRNGGTSWTRILSNIFYAGSTLYFKDPITDVLVIDENNMIAYGEASINDGILLLKTTDGGVTWQPISDGKVNNRYDLDFYGKINDMKQGGNSNTLYCKLHANYAKSVDGGATWVENSQGVGMDKSLDFVNANEGFCYSSGLKKTSNGGETWSAVPIYGYPYAGHFEQFVAAPSQRFVYVVGTESDWILKFDLTNNTATALTAPVKEYINDCQFVNDSLGFVVGGNGMLLKYGL